MSMLKNTQTLTNGCVAKKTKTIKKNNGFVVKYSN